MLVIIRLVILCTHVDTVVQQATSHKLRCLGCLQGEQAVWDNLLAWLTATTSKPAVQECAVALLSVIASRKLAPNLQLRSEQLWSLPVLQRTPLPAAAAPLICAAFSQGQSVLTCMSYCLPHAAKNRANHHLHVKHNVQCYLQPQS